MPITFHNADIKFTVPQKAELRSFITGQVKAAANKKPQLSFVFCSDEYLLNINRQFLQHDYYTDIITFDLDDSSAHPLTAETGEPARTANMLEGEIYISIDRVRDNAQKLKVDFKHELLRVIFHGVLHLLGYKDKTKTQKAGMRKAEDAWMKKFMA